MDLGDIWSSLAAASPVDYPVQVGRVSGLEKVEERWSLCLQINKKHLSHSQFQQIDF